MSNFYNTANIKTKGRYGDTSIRTVHGEEAHVNPMEAYLIDTYDRAGEDLVAKHGSGTINPNTGMPEYFNLKNLSWAGIFKTGRHHKSVAKAKRGASRRLDLLSGRVKDYMKPGGTLSRLFSGQFDELASTYKDQLGESQDQMMELYESSGLEGGIDKSSEMLRNMYSKYKTQFGSLGEQKRKSGQDFLSMMEEKKSQVLRDFQSATGYAYGGGGGGAEFDRSVNQYG